MLPPVFAATHPRACSTAFERVGFTGPHNLYKTQIDKEALLTYSG
jgi:hypothetical protein